MQANIHFTENCLVSTFAISREKAEEAMALLRECRDLLQSGNYACHYSHEVALTLEMVSPRIGGHGVDGFLFEDNVQNGGLYYVNMGDPYHTTIVWSDINSSFSISDWGTHVEEWEAARDQATEDELTYRNEIRLR